MRLLGLKRVYLIYLIVKILFLILPTIFIPGYLIDILLLFMIISPIAFNKANLISVLKILSSSLKESNTLFEIFFPSLSVIIILSGCFNVL